MWTGNVQGWQDVSFGLLSQQDQVTTSALVRQNYHLIYSQLILVYLVILWEINIDYFILNLQALLTPNVQERPLVNSWWLSQSIEEYGPVQSNSLNTWRPPIHVSGVNYSGLSQLFSYQKWLLLKIITRIIKLLKILFSHCKALLTSSVQEAEPVSF